MNRLTYSLLGLAALFGPTLACFNNEPETSSGSAESSATGTETGGCPIGAEGCPCTNEGVCDPGLECVGSGVCAEAMSETETGTDTEGEACGNGVVEGDEECDAGAANDDAAACTSACKLAICGDNLVQDNLEQCDTGVESATCDDDCTLPECGDGVINEAAGETCDDGNLDPSDDCTDQCLLATCGDGILNENEECDDGNVDPDDDCTSDCKSLWWAEGPQADIPQANLVGWELCWSGLYAGSGEPVADILAQCTKANLLVGCRPVSSTDMSLLAMAEREAVLFDTDTTNIPYNSNGVGWYYSDSYSWGFALEGDAIQRSSCDTLDDNPEFRMCWHTSGGNINGGYRCGETKWLNSSEEWTRLVFQAD